jgi:predicted amidohydrolase
MLKLDRRKVDKAKQVINAWHTRTAPTGIKAFGEGPLKSLARAKALRARTAILARRTPKPYRVRGTKGSSMITVPWEEFYRDPGFWSSISDVLASSRETLSTVSGLLSTTRESLPEMGWTTHISDAEHYTDLAAESLEAAEEEARAESERVASGRAERRKRRRKL